MKRVLYISLVDWFWIKQRPQQLCEQLSDLNYYVDYFCIRAWKNKNKVQKHSEGDDIGLNNIEITDKLRIFRNHVIPKGKYTLINNINGLYLRTKIDKLFSDNNYDFIVVTHPSQLLYLSKHVRQKAKIIYDCMDSYKDFPMNKYSKNRVIKLEKKIINIASNIIVSSTQIKNNLISTYKISSQSIKTINNGVDINNFNINKLSQVTSNELLNKENNISRKITYIGTISNWVDLKLVIDTADFFKKDTFYLIGPIDIDVPKQLPDNIIFTGPKRYELIPLYIGESDILLMPFKLNDVVKSVNPVKLYEYLAMGKDIIATKYSETLRFSSLVYLYSSKKEFFHYISILGKEKNEETIEKRILFAKKNSWQSRASALTEILR